MKIFEFDNADEMKSDAVAGEVDVDGNPVNKEKTPVVTADALGGGLTGGATEEKAERNARIARESVELLAEEEAKMEEVNHGIKFAIRPIKNFSLCRVEFPMEIINEINDHIDNEIIPKNDSFANGLVGQLKNDKKSAQLDFPLDTEVGKQLETVFNQIGSTFLKKGYERDSMAEVYQCWTNHAYAGDYNPYHDHGVQTMAGLSGFLWLKTPECIEKLDEVPTGLNNASGAVDGFTHLIWGTHSRKDTLQLRGQTEDYVKPIVGTMLVFPNWLKHQVLPFFGEGERRSMAMNWNVTDSEQEIMKHLSEREKIKYEELKAEKEKSDD